MPHDRPDRRADPWRAWRQDQGHEDGHRREPVGADAAWDQVDPDRDHIQGRQARGPHGRVSPQHEGRPEGKARSADLEIAPSSGISVGVDGIARCSWGDSDDYRRYHDSEWGRPVDDDRRLFEKLMLEGFMSGLSWLTILRKRENFRAAFRGFDPKLVARFGARDAGRLMADPGIVRNRAKIDATINNARRCAQLVREFGTLAAYVWGYDPIRHNRLLDSAGLAVRGAL